MDTGLSHGDDKMNCCYTALPQVDLQVTPVSDRLWSDNLMQHIFADLLASNPLLKKYESCDKTRGYKTTINDYSCSFSNTTDFTMHLDDGDIKVHKLLLISSSSYFRCMLSSDCEEHSEGAVSLPNIKLDTLFVLLKYIYTGTADLKNGNVLNVWRIADYFQVLPLVKLCCHFVKIHLCSENSLLVYNQADIHQFHDLAWQAMSTVSIKLPDILANVPHHLKDASPSTMQAIIKHTNCLFGIPLLLKFIQALKLWCQYDASRYPHISRILTIAELCILANQFPEMAAHLSLHPQATLQEDHDQYDSFDQLLIQSSLSFQQIVISFGGQHNGTILKSGESYNPDSQYFHTENNRQIGHARNWTFGYLTPDVQDAIKHSKHLEEFKCKMFLPNESLMKSARSKQDDQENKTWLDEKNGLSGIRKNKKQEVTVPAMMAEGGCLGGCKETKEQEFSRAPVSAMAAEDNVILAEGNGTSGSARHRDDFPTSNDSNVISDENRIEYEGISNQNVIDTENFTYGIGDAKLDKIVSDAFRKRFVFRDKFLIAPFGARWCSSGSRLKINQIIKECEGVMNGAIASFVDTNKIVVLGGRDLSGPVCTVQQYCIDTNSWSLLPPLPTPVYGGAAAVINRVLYYVAGATSFNTKVEAEGVNMKAHNGVYRRGNVNVLADVSKTAPRASDSSWSNTTHYLNNLWRLKIGADRWEALCPLPGDGRCHVAAAVLNDSLVVTGGLTREGEGWASVSNSENSAPCWRYEPSTDEWIRMANLRQGRAYHGAAVSCHKLYVMGGKSGATWLSSVERYDPSTDSWVHVPDMLTPRSEFGVTVRAEDIYVVGGFTGHKATNQLSEDASC